MSEFAGIIIRVCVALAALAAVPVYAQSADEPICADIFPCNPDGSVIAPFNEPSACQPVYARICKQAFCSNADQTIKSCKNQNTFLTSEVIRLQKENDLLRKKIRVAKRAKR